MAASSLCLFAFISPERKEAVTFREPKKEEVHYMHAYVPNSIAGPFHMAIYGFYKSKSNHKSPSKRNL